MKLSSTSDPRLILKATPPRVSKTLLSRSRLSSTAPGLADKSVVLVQAPAGFGKTSLLSQWRREALRRGAVAAWLTVDDMDHDTRFVQALVAGIAMATVGSGFRSSHVRAADPIESDLEALTNWLAGVAHMAVHIELSLDDVHTLPQSTLETSLLYLIRNAPSNLRIFLGSRKPLALEVSDLLDHGQFALLDADSLTLSLDETIAIVTSRFASRADSDLCARLHDLTEGWPLGLQLAMATIERKPNLGEALVGFSARAGDVQRYFVECLMNRLSPGVADFLIRVSVVDALHPELCQAITGRADSAELLAHLQGETPIVLGAIDSDWLRIHSLAREFLKDRFHELPIEERRRAHGRAARWLAERQMFEAAARQALHAGQDQLAHEYMTYCLYEMVVSGQGHGVSEWVERLPRTEIESSPRLRLAVAWTLATSKRHDEAIKLVTPLLDDPATDPGQRCESAEICASAALFADDFDDMERIIAPWAGALRTLPAMQHVVGINQLAVTALYRGMPEKARYHYREIPSERALNIGHYTRGLMDWVIGASHLWQGQVLLADEHLRPALARAEDERGRRSPVAAMLASALAMALWEQDLTDELAPLLAHRLDVLERRCPPDTILMGYLSAARGATREGSERRAFNLLEGLYALGEARKLPRLCVFSLAEQVRMHAFHAHAEACSALIARLDALATPATLERLGLLAPLVGLQIGLARTYAAVAAQDWRRSLAELDVVRPLAGQLRRGRDLVQISLLQALALTHCDEDGLALFNEAISMAKTMGLQRILEDTHPDLIDIQRQVRSSYRPAVPSAPTEVESQPLPAHPVARAGVSASVLLTPKEAEVLQLLAGNLSNKQIALALDVGSETVKWHLKNLFSKLEAGNRRHLLARARMLGVLDVMA